MPRHSLPPEWAPKVTKVTQSSPRAIEPRVCAARSAHYALQPWRRTLDYARWLLLFSLLWLTFTDRQLAWTMASEFTTESLPYYAPRVAEDAALHTDILRLLASRKPHLAARDVLAVLAAALAVLPASDEYFHRYPPYMAQLNPRHRLALSSRAAIQPSLSDGAFGGWRRPPYHAAVGGGGGGAGDSPFGGAAEIEGHILRDGVRTRPRPAPSRGAAKALDWRPPPKTLRTGAGGGKTLRTGGGGTRLCGLTHPPKTLRIGLGGTPDSGLGGHTRLWAWGLAEVCGLPCLCSRAVLSPLAGVDSAPFSMLGSRGSSASGPCEPLSSPHAPRSAPPTADLPGGHSRIIRWGALRTPTAWPSASV